MDVYIHSTYVHTDFYVDKVYVYVYCMCVYVYIRTHVHEGIL